LEKRVKLLIQQPQFVLADETTGGHFAEQTYLLRENWRGPRREKEEIMSFYYIKVPEGIVGEGKGGLTQRKLKGK